jgi:hypothetical protein
VRQQWLAWLSLGLGTPFPVLTLSRWPTSMNGFLVQVILVVLALCVSAILLLWSATSIRYHLTAKHLKVTWLGLPVRFLALQDIKHISHRPVFWAERWPSTLFDSRRMLVIRRRGGLFKHFVITPKYPFEFKASLEHARKRSLPGAPGSGASTPTNPHSPLPPSTSSAKAKSPA